MGKRWVNVELRQTLWNVESELRGLQDIEAQAPELMDEQRKGRRDELTKQLPKLRIQYGLCGGDGGIPDKGQAATDMRGWELLYMPDAPDEATAIQKALSSEPAPATTPTPAPAPAPDVGPQAIDPQAVAAGKAAQTAPATAANLPRKNGRPKQNKNAVTQAYAAKKLRKDIDTIRRWENGEVTPPKDYPGRADEAEFLRFVVRYLAQQNEKKAKMQGNEKLYREHGDEEETGQLDGYQIHKRPNPLIR